MRGLVNDTFLMMHTQVGCTFQEEKKNLRKAKAICNWTIRIKEDLNITLNLEDHKA